MATAPPPGDAFVAWAKAMPGAHCAPAALRPWTHAGTASSVPITLTGKLDDVTVPTTPGLTTVSSGKDQLYYGAGMAGTTAVLNAGSEADESSFTAVFAAAPKPPRALVALDATPRAGHVGIGTSRATIERLLGKAHATHACGEDIVRYEPRNPVMSEAEIWFFYRAGVVAGFVRYDAV